MFRRLGMGLGVGVFEAKGAVCTKGKRRDPAWGAKGLDGVQSSWSSIGEAGGGVRLQEG